MSKKVFIIIAFAMSITIANADIQSPFGANHQMNMQAAQAKAANEAEMDILDMINEKPLVQAGTRKSDALKSFYNSESNVPAGINDSKTIYTDDLGRLHFFGKGN